MSNNEIKLPIQMCDPTRIYNKYKEQFDDAIKNVINGGMYINGSEVSELEDKLAEYLGVDDVVSCSDGTSALQLALMAIGVNPGDEVITVGHSWISSANIISLLRAVPVFADIDEQYFILDSSELENKITRKTKAIIVVSLYGQISPHIDKICEIASKHNIFVVEDAAQSFGSLSRGRRSGSIADIGTFSFFPTKPLSSFGDSGAVTVPKNADFAKKVRALKNHGCLQRFHHDYIGMNSRLDTIQAAVLLVKFDHLEESLENRNKVASSYTKRLKHLEEKGLIKLPKTHEDNYHVWAQYSILTKSNKAREYIYAKLRENKINVAIFYPKPLHTQKCFEYLGYKEGDLPVTERVCNTIINVPLYAEFNEDEIEYVCKYFEKFLLESEDL
jgi:UDP-2-acetamido-2-deoxy-ribo-hexuluronate aminotransferase